ncbi:MAG TPA: lipid II flippase MurJ [Bryobacteraceae bacterium]|jgi:peptidoglycan biosynthesis protein MviN/MurJ (putative lipid II flippase)|nr:lipid II flippase MurJ [Bryobacteraceae bacterium]
MTRTVAALASVMLLAAIAGAAREMATASVFGASRESDVLALLLLYLEAVSSLIIHGVGGYVLVPITVRLAAEGNKHEAFSVMECMILWSGALCLPLAAAVLIFPNAVSQLLVSGFGSIERNLFIAALPVGMLTLGLAMIGSYMAGVLQGLRQYNVPAWGRLALSASVAGGIWCWGHRFGLAAALACMAAGAAAQTLIQAGSLWHLGWRPSLPSLRHPRLRTLLKTALPGLLSGATIYLLMPAWQRSLATSLPTGSIASIQYAYRAANIASSLTMAVATVAFTELSQVFSAKKGEQATTEALLSKLRSVLFMFWPLGVLLCLISEDLANILFGSGLRGSAFMAVTITCQRWFTACLAPSATLGILHRALPAFGRIWSAAGASCVWTVSAVIGTFLLMPSRGAASVPMGHFAGCTVACLFSFWRLRDLVDAEFLRELGRYVWKLILPMSAALAAAWFIPSPRIGGEIAGRLLHLGSQSVAFGSVFGALCILMREPESMRLATQLRTAATSFRRRTPSESPYGVR